MQCSYIRYLFPGKFNETHRLFFNNAAASVLVILDRGDFVSCHSRSWYIFFEPRRHHQAGPYYLLSKHYLPGGSIAPNVFDLEHAGTGPKLKTFHIYTATASGAPAQEDINFA